MKKAKRMFAALLSAAMLGTAFAVPSMTYAENDSINIETSVNYRMSLGEVITDISGNYVWMREKEPVFIPTSDCNRGVQTIDENNKIHNINFANIKTVIKVKNGCKLPYDEIKAEIEAKGYTMPVFRINGDEYEITWAVSKEIYDYTIELLKKCPVVTAMETRYKIWEDTANSVRVYGIAYKGDLSAEEITAKYPELEQMEGYSAEALEFYFKEDDTNLYDFFCRANENSDALIAMYAQTELGVMYPDYHYCSEPIIIDVTEGDSNIDGDVDLADSVMIMQSIANPDKYGVKAEKGITEQGIANADTDGNGLTNMDSLEIQKSLLGLGTILIPEKNKGTDTASDDGILLANYDTDVIDEPYGYRTVTINDTELRKTGVSVNISAIGDEIGEYIVKSTDGEVTAKAYEIKNISPDYAVAVKCEGSNNYTVFNNWQYIPGTMGQLIDGMNLSENLTFSGVHYDTYTPYKIRKCKAEKELIWNSVFADRDVEIMKHDFSNDQKNKPQRVDGKLPEGYVELGIVCDMPISGRYNFSIKVYQNGYVTSNLIETGISFFIAEEKAQELIAYYTK